MRIELRDGQWAELRERITHAQDKTIRRARVRSRANLEEAAGEGDTAALREFIAAWSVVDPSGNAINLADADAIDRMPMDIADVLIEHIIPLLARATVPNEPTPPSSDA